MEHCYYRTILDPTNMYDKNWKYVPTKIFDLQLNIVPITDYFIKYLESFGLLFDSTLFFYSKIALNCTAHIDMYTTGGLANPGLNYIIGGKNSLMTWYNTPTYTEKPSLSSAGVIYQEFLVKDLELIDSYELKQNELTLVRVDIPHSVRIGQEPRMCISIRFKPKKHIPWNSHVEMFSAKGLIIPR